MRKAFSIIPLILTIFSVAIYAQDPESLEEARNLAVSRGKPILMEFLRPG